MLLFTLLTFFFVQGVDLRQYSKQVEAELQRIEQASIKDCILNASIQFLWEKNHLANVSLFHCFVLDIPDILYYSPGYSYVLNWSVLPVLQLSLTKDW